MRLNHSLVVLLLAAVNFGCVAAGPDAPASGLTVKQFVDVYVALRRAQSTARSPVEFEAAKQKALQQARVREQDLEAFIAEHASDVGMMADVWDTIGNRLTKVANGDTPE
jgi:hypothetical protein